MAINKYLSHWHRLAYSLDLEKPYALCSQNPEKLLGPWVDTLLVRSLFYGLNFSTDMKGQNSQRAKRELKRLWDFKITQQGKKGSCELTQHSALMRDTSSVSEISFWDENLQGSPGCARLGP